MKKTFRWSFVAIRVRLAMQEKWFVANQLRFRVDYWSNQLQQTKTRLETKTNAEKITQNKCNSSINHWCGPHPSLCLHSLQVSISLCSISSWIVSSTKKKVLFDMKNNVWIHKLIAMLMTDIYKRTILARIELHRLRRYKDLVLITRGGVALWTVLWRITNCLELFVNVTWIINVILCNQWVQLSKPSISHNNNI